MRHTEAIGVDVSDSSIKVLTLSEEGSIVAYGSIELEKGIVENGEIRNIDIFVQRLISLLQNTKPRTLFAPNAILRAILCLPETKLFTHYLFIPDSVHKSEWRTYVQEDAEKIIPFALSELYWDCHIAEKDGVASATFVGVPKTDLDAYVEAFSHAKIKPIFVGSELFSLGRALLPDAHLQENHMILDMGARTTTIGMFSDDAIANVSIVIPRGGDLFTKVIADEMELDVEEAEARKRRYGLNPHGEGSFISAALLPHMKDIAGKIIEAKEYFEKKTGKPVTHITVAGGSAQLPGLIAFLEAETKIKTVIADPVSRIKNHEIFGTNTPQVLFATVIGLALHAHSRLPNINLLKQYQFQEGEAKKELLNLSEIRSADDLRYMAFWFFHKIKVTLLLWMSGIHLPKRHTLKLVGSFSLLLLTLAFLVWVIMRYL